MKLLETIKSKLIAAVLAIWAWLKLKAVQWQLREKAIALWEKAKAFYVRMGVDRKSTRLNSSH